MKAAFDFETRVLGASSPAVLAGKLASLAALAAVLTAALGTQEPVANDRCLKSN